MLSLFVTLSDPAQPRANLILHTLPPFPVVQVWMFNTEEEYENFTARKLHYALPGYRIAFTFYATLAEEYPENEVLKHAADFYARERIKTSEGRYKRYERD